MRVVALVFASRPLCAHDASQTDRRQQFVSFYYRKANVVVAGVAEGQDVVFFGEPLNAVVVVLSRGTPESKLGR